MKVFLADDHVLVRDGLRMLLASQKDIDVVGEAGEGREAVKKVKELKPDIILLDIAMPGLNGIDAAMKIGLECPSTQVIILSMYYTAEHVRRAMDAGVRGYVLKEYMGAEVIKAIQAVHSGSRYMSEKIMDRVFDRFAGEERNPEAKNPLMLLGLREREVLQLVVEGKSSSEIGEILFLSPKTIETYRCRLMQKLEVNNLPSLVRLAIRHGLIPLE